MMSTDIRKSLAQDEEDHRALLNHAFRGMPLDPEISRRVQEKAENVREDMRVRGVKIDAVELIRESRDELLSTFILDACV